MSSDARTARPGADDGFHEIHLSGKQLFFLFMATTVVSVVIFLCGVLVGRGARVEPVASDFDAGQPAPAVAPATQAEPVIDSAAPPAAPASTSTQVESGDVDYYQTLTAEQAKDEVVQPPAESGEAARPGSDADAAAAPPTADAEAPAPAPVPAAPAAKPGAWTIQVAALKERDEADRIAERLQSRGYEAFVAEPVPGTAMFRVRVGQFSDRAEAERVKTRLAREEKFKPWVTR
jgi:DedD protein